MLQLTPVPMEQFRLRWRLTDPKYRVLAPAHLEQFLPLDAGSANHLLEMTTPWFREQPITRGYFEDVASISLAGRNDPGHDRKVRKWLYQRGIPFKHRVLLSWSETEALATTWKMVVKYWDDLWYPGSDDLAIFDESLSWLLFLWHEEEAYFASRPVRPPPPTGA